LVTPERIPASQLWTIPVWMGEKPHRKAKLLVHDPPLRVWANPHLATISEAARSITAAKGQAQLRAGEAVFPDRAHQPSRTRRSCPPSVPHYSTLGRLETTPGLYPRRYRSPPAYAVGRFAPFLLLGGRPRGRRCSGCWRQDTPARGPPGRHARRASRHHHRLLDTPSGCSMSGEDRAWRSRNSKAKESKDTDMDQATESYGHPMCGACVYKR